MSRTHHYRFTHNKVIALDGEEPSSTVLPPPATISLPALCGFSAVLFTNEFERVGARNVDVAETCNLSEWHRRLFAGKNHTEETEDSQGEPIDIASLPAKHPARSGFIYATTTGKNEDPQSNPFSAFLFAIHKRSLSKPIDQQHYQQLQVLSAEIQQKVDELGVTHIWLCGTAPEYRRLHLMSDMLNRLERDVAAWKAEGLASGMISVHTIPQYFPSMVKFLQRHGFQGGQRYEAGDDKVVYWKEV